MSSAKLFSFWKGLKFVVWERVNLLPNDEILAVTKLKTSEDGRINEAQMMISVFNRLENIVGKGENASYQRFLTMFSKGSFLWGLCDKESTHQQQTAFKNIVGKKEIAHNEQFLLFPQCFLAWLPAFWVV